MALFSIPLRGTVLPPKRFRAIKQEIRIVGVDDGVFTPHTKGLADVIGVVFRGGYWLDGIMRTVVTIDGMDATEKIAGMIMDSPHYAQVRIVMLNGVTFAGFNVVDIKELFERTRLPVIAVTREKPDFEDIRKALTHLPDGERRWRIIEDARGLIRVRSRKGESPIFMQVAGIAEEDAEKVVREVSTRSNVPEPLRVAHIIASGLTRINVKN
jgi:hypothetical protein